MRGPDVLQRPVPWRARRSYGLLGLQLMAVRAIASECSGESIATAVARHGSDTEAPPSCCFDADRFRDLLHPSPLPNTNQRATHISPAATHPHADKTGGTNSSPLFAAIRTAYETLATSRDRALYKTVPAGDGDAVFCWAVEVGAASTRGSTGGGAVAVTASGQGNSSVRPVKGEYPRRWVSREESGRHRRSGSGSNGALFGETGFCRKDSAAENQEKLGGSRQGRWEARGRDTQQREDPGSDDTKKHQQQQEKVYAQDYTPVGIEGEGDGFDVEDHTGRQAESVPKVPSVVPREMKGHGEKQHSGQEHVKESQRGEEKKENEAVGSKVDRPASVDADGFSKAPQHTDSSPAPFAGDGGAHQSIPPFVGRQKPRQQPGNKPAPGNGVGSAHQCRHTKASARTGSPRSPPSQPMEAASGSCSRTSTQPRSEETVVSGREPASKPSAVTSSPGSSGERNMRKGERIVKPLVFQGLFRAHGLEASSDSGGFSDDGGVYNSGGGCVRRLRESVTTRGRDPYHSATASSSPVSGVSLEWLKVAQRRLSTDRTLIPF